VQCSASVFSSPPADDVAGLLRAELERDAEQGNPAAIGLLERR